MKGKKRPAAEDQATQPASQLMGVACSPRATFNYMEVEEKLRKPVPQADFKQTSLGGVLRKSESSLGY